MYDIPDEAGASWASRFFLLDPTFGLLLTVLIILGGVMAYFSLVKESLPDLSIPQATIVTTYPGADPATVEVEVTEEIEKEIQSLRGLKQVTSASFDSASIIAVEFEASADLTESMQLLRSRVSDAEGELPDAAETPGITQVSVDDRPIMTVALYGDVGAAVISRTAKDLEDRLEQVRGVKEVDIGGLRDEVVQIQLLPDRILALGILPTQVRTAVTQANIDLPLGEIDSEAIGATVRLFGRFRDVEDLKRLPVARLDDMAAGRIVRLGEIADVRRTLEDDVTRAFFSWEGAEYGSAIEVSVKKTPWADVVSVIGRVKAELEEIRVGRGWPVGLDYRVTQDESEQIWTSLIDVFNNGWQAMLAVFVILFLLLSWREGVIAGLSVPLTFLGALILIWLVGFTLNELVIIGMVLALGLLVDVFILMMEGLHEGIFVDHLTFGQSVLRTVKKYAVPAFAGTMTTVLALAPLTAIGGVAGSFIRVLPITAIACLIVAFVVAFAVDLPLSRYLLGRLAEKRGEERTTRVDRWTAAAGEKLKNTSLRLSLVNRWIAFAWVGAAGLILVLSLVAFTRVPVVMYPKSDGLKLGINVELPPTTDIETSQEVADRLGSLLREKPYFESVMKLVGKKSPLASVGLADALQPSEAENFLGFSALFKERDQRDADGYELADELRLEMQALLDANYAGATLTVVPETGQPSNDAPVQIELTGSDMATLRSISAEVQTALRGLPGTSDVGDNIGNVRPEIKLIPRREAIDFYGLTQQELASQISYELSNNEIGKFDIGGLEDDLEIRLGIAWPSRDGGVGGPTRIEELALVRAFTPQGESVPMLSLVQPSVSTAPLSITHQNGRRSISVTSKTTDATTPTAVVADLAPIIEELSQGWPAGYGYSFGGESAETAETFASAGVALVIAVVLIFGVLVLVFGSFAQAFILILTLPLALIGTFLGFWLIGQPFSFFAMVGLISLVGIVANDSIVMVDTMNGHVKAGIDVRTAAARGASDRLRPIISTSLTTIIGLIPLAVSNPMWRPLCYAIIFGLLGSTVIALVIVPCLYYLFTRRHMHFDTASPV